MEVLLRLLLMCNFDWTGPDFDEGDDDHSIQVKYEGNKIAFYRELCRWVLEKKIKKHPIVLFLALGLF